MPAPDSAAPGPRGAASNAAARRALLAVCVVLITHGSLHPWQFTAPPSVAAAWHAMWAQRNWWTGLGDVTGNIVLFVPLGVLAVWGRRGGRVTPGRALVAMGSGTIFALLLQLLQIWLPARSPSLSDVWWNGVGMALGIAVARAVQQLPSRAATRTGRLPDAGALALIGLWLAIEWWPFVPTIDWQQIKNALKPLLLRPELAPRSFAEAALGTAIVVHTLRDTRRRAAFAFTLVAGALLGKLFVSGQALSPSHAAGWLAGLAAGAALWRARMRAAALAVLLAAVVWFTIDELRPFRVTTTPGAFSWIPFVGSLRGSLVSNVLALAWLAFWLGAVMVSARALGARLGVPALALGLWALLLEALQIWLPGRTADVTPALLPALWWLLLRAWPPLPRRGDASARDHPNRV